MRFNPHPQAAERKRSASTLVKLLLANVRPEILPAHLRELLDALLWKLTEAESQKYKTRFQSQGAIECNDNKILRHEHVYQKSKMIDALLQARPEEVDAILESAIPCTVTVAEHARLSAFDHLYGWERYRSAGIVVINTETGERLS